MAIAVVVGASLFYYGYWNPKYVVLLLASIGANYIIGCVIVRRRGTAAKSFLVLGIVGNLALLGYFKYADFFLETMNRVVGFAQPSGDIVLPLAISFFTFQQIAYLVDTFRGQVREHAFLTYMLFVSFFPQLIAGPIVHHGEMMPQFARKTPRARIFEHLAVGGMIFVIGLAKKVLVADQIAVYANPVFAAAAGGEAVDFYAAWAGALSYTFQLYFDFSGYTDMAVGAARMFGIRLPVNFFSPYKATNISDFWRRWHMTLSRFLRDYLYFPLGGNRKGTYRRLANLMVTMLLGGLWHGAGWTFVLWGGLHGGYLAAHQAWRHFGPRIPGRRSICRLIPARLLTFVSVVFGWVLFRAEDVESAVAMMRAMVGLEGLSLPQSLVVRGVLDGAWLARLGVGVSEVSLRPALLSALLLAVVWWLPNTYEIMGRYRPVILPAKAPEPATPGRLVWRPNFAWSVYAGVLFVLCCLGLLADRQEFLYYEF